MADSSPFLYKNITTSGLPGAGSTTLLNSLRDSEELKFAGWTGFSGGEFMRAYALEKGWLKEGSGLHHSAAVYGEDFDRQVDLGIREKLETQEGWIIESWLSGFMAQGVSSTLKILMICSNTAVKVDRIVNRDKVTPEEALQHMHERYNTNVAKWRRMYKQEWHDWVKAKGKLAETTAIDFWHKDLYDIVIDTYSHNQQEALELVTKALNKRL